MYDEYEGSVRYDVLYGLGKLDDEHQQQPAAHSSRRCSSAGAVIRVAVFITRGKARQAAGCNSKWSQSYSP